MRLLIGTRPDVDVAIMEVFAFPIERTVVRRHRLDDEVVCFPEPVHDADSILVGAGELIRDPLDEAHVEPAARDHVDEAMSFARDRASVAFPIHGDAGPIAAIAIEGPVLRVDMPGTLSDIDQWRAIVGTLQSVVDVAPRDFAGPFAQRDPASIKLRSAY